MGFSWLFDSEPRDRNSVAWVEWREREDEREFERRLKRQASTLFDRLVTWGPSSLRKEPLSYREASEQVEEFKKSRRSEWHYARRMRKEHGPYWATDGFEPGPEDHSHYDPDVEGYS